MFETIPCEIRNTQTPFKNLLLAVDRLISSEKAILGGTGHKRYLSPSLKSTALLEFTDQDMICGMMFRFTCKMDASLPIFIFMVLPVLMDSFRLFLFIGLLNDVTPLSKWFCIKQSLSWILVCLTFNDCRTSSLSSTLNWLNCLIKSELLICMNLW